MPLARRMSNSSVASASSKQAFPSTINSSTRVTKEKVGKIMTRRKTRQQVAMVDKENEENVMQSPTPYWKVAQERGTTTPPQTRSNKKRKKTAGAKKLDFVIAGGDLEEVKNLGGGGGLLIFSPPDQKANAFRQQQEIERKEKERASRIKNARESGQLLVFSPTLRHATPSASTESQDREKIDKNVEPSNVEHTSVDGEADCNSLDDDLSKDYSANSPLDMEVEVSAKGSEKGQVSFAAAHTDAHSEAITSELKNLRETINKLVDRKSTSDESKQHHISLEAHMIRAEGILLENSKLESKVESLQNTLKETHAKTSEERERLEHKIACMRTELNSASDDARKQADTLEQVRIDMENQLKENQAVKEEFIRQINSLQVELDDVRRRFLESRELIEALNGELEGERQSMAEERRELQNSGSLLEREIEELSKANDALQFSISRYEEKIDSLENLMLPESEDQLCNALEKLKQFEEREVGLRLEMLEYEKRMKTLTEELSQVQEEREQERQHFQQLNEESSNAYEQMRKNLKEKDAIINDLKVEIEEALASLASESRKLSDTTEELQTLRSRMDGRTDELEKMLQEATSKLKQGTEEKELLEEKLAMIIEDVKENASFKEHVLAQSNEAHIANHLLKKRIEELEQDLQASKSDCDDARMRVETFHEREAELYKQLQESDRVRRSLHNRVMQLSGNIRVYIRVRPELPGEMEEVARSGSKTMPEASNKKRKHCKIEMVSPFQYPGMGGQESAGKSLFGADDPTKNILEVIEPMRDRGGLSERRKKWVFGFDNVFTPSHCQEDIWEATEPLVQSAIDGFNVTLFAYGQTGSGKTFTMLGERGNEGIISRSIQKFFDAKESIEALSRGECNVEISVELLEIYNEKVRDLLDSSKPDGRELSLKIKANEAVGSTVLPATSKGEVECILNKAQSRRCVKSTASNAVSSRSHMLFTMYFRIHSKDGATRVGKLNVCDLAGSERLGKSNANQDVGGALLQETKHINSSLSVLSNVIEKLQAGDSNVPYRESKLTYLLQNSLGGNSKTLAIICCNPLQSHFHESLCSLRFAAKVNKVDLKAVANFSA